MMRLKQRGGGQPPTQLAMDEKQVPPCMDRREFAKRACAVCLGGVSMLVPAAAGLAVFLDPLRQRSSKSGFISVAAFKAVPADGLPRKFSVITDRQDVWNKFPNVPVGAVYLRRTGEQTVQALNVVCPHAGCFVDFRPELKSYLCPCHNSSFALDGKISDPSSPSPRGLDTLEVQVANGEVLVKFQNFRAGTAHKIPVA